MKVERVLKETKEGRKRRKERRKNKIKNPSYLMLWSSDKTGKRTTQTTGDR